MAGPTAPDADVFSRLQALEGLLATLTDVLDVRQVFQQVSGIARHAIDHDMLLLTLLSDDRAHVTVHAVTGETAALPATMPIPVHQRALLSTDWRSVNVPDMHADPLERVLPPAEAGYRSRLVVPLRLQGRLGGALDFFSRQPYRYDDRDVLLARRIADHVVLALSHQRLAEEAERAAEARERAVLLERRVSMLVAEVDALGGRQRLVGESAAWQQALGLATQVAATETTVLLLGESGTGKEVMARFIHRASARHAGPFVAINCAALPEHLLESELFGHERGAFTGAVTSKPGRLELAASGVLFLDEIGEMSLSAQAKLLRVLQEREFQRLGGTRSLKANVRVIAATNRDLSAAIARGAFRDDLYYRLAVFEIALPPLRERRQDILALTETFLEEIGRGLGRPPAGIASDARRHLLEYAWPGNVRQLRNALERAAILCQGGLITRAHLALPAAGVTSTTPRSREAPPRNTLPEAGQGCDLATLERRAIEEALKEARFNKSTAARRLGLTRAQLYVRLRRYGLD